MNSQNNIHVVSRAVILSQDSILLCKTNDLQHNFYFLPGGHVENGESVTNALLRELKEEIGEDCTIKRFLGCLEYSFVPGHSSICHNHEYNFIFEAHCLQLNKSQTPPKQEAHIDLLWHPVAQLHRIDFRAEPLKDILPKWLNSNNEAAFASVMVNHA